MFKRFLLAAPVLLIASAVGAPTRALAPQPGDNRPLYYSREITRNDLLGRWLRDLSLMRNTIYARAGHRFRKRWLIDYFSAQPWYHPLDRMDDSKITELDRRNAEAIVKYEAEIGRDELLQWRKYVFAQVPQSPERTIELRLISMRLGSWAGDSNEVRTPLEDPMLLDKQITVQQLSDLSRRDLRLLRNLIYARHGRPFKSELLRRYFSALDWYNADPSYTDARLTPLDKRNINVVLSVENSLGGPLSDYQHKKEDGWFAAA